MRLVTIDEGVRGSPGALLASGEVLHLARAAAPATVECWLPMTLRDILDAGEAGLGVVREIVERAEATSGEARAALRRSGAVTSRDATRLLAPIPEPRLVIGGGLNYRSHLREMPGTPEPSRPTGFIKAAASIVGPDAVIHTPRQAANMVDWEGELACVIGRTCHDVSTDEALSCIAGYTIVNDLSARDWVGDVFTATQPWEARLTWELNIMGKQFAGFTAMGPVLATTDEVGDPNDLTLETRLNGEVVQYVHTSDVVFGFAESMAFFSRWYTFHPGDLITTGTPAGVGAGRKPPRYMRQGDLIEVEISWIGTLRNTIGSPRRTGVLSAIDRGAQAP
jgi:2-keto-4-pentenoate hydratase/2-oxohepta-3-ene-1,7-dioic acid hydratase in catechol pathway